MLELRLDSCCSYSSVATYTRVALFLAQTPCCSYASVAVGASVAPPLVLRLDLRRREDTLAPT